MQILLKGIDFCTKITKNILPTDKMDKNMSYITDKMAHVAVWHTLRRNKAEIIMFNLKKIDYEY